MPFPDDYIEDLIEGEKIVTIRVGQEIGKYEVGKVYRACTYDGEYLGIFVLILGEDIVSPERLNIPRYEKERVKKEGGLCQVIIFKVVK